jgi:hypothetical protein
LVTPRTLCKKTSRLSLKNSSTCRNYRRLSWLVASLVLLCLAHTAAAIDPNREPLAVHPRPVGKCKGISGWPGLRDHANERRLLMDRR